MTSLPDDNLDGVNEGRKYPDGTVEHVDEAELAAAVDAGDVSGDLADKARDVAAAVENAL